MSETLVKLGGTPPLLGVTPEQFYGLEINPRAARVAELVLWIGYLQLYAREHGKASPPEPILKAFHNIVEQDAVLAYDGIQPKTDKDGNPITRWDGVSTVKHPVTGRDVPDETALIQDSVYLNPRPAAWAKATFIVSNPPFIGGGPMRFALGDGYTETLRKTYKDVGDSSDFVMYWWYKAAQHLESDPTLRRFGFVTTNSIKQTLNRKIVAEALTKDLSLAYAVPDHPWVDEVDGAAVRIAMTVAQRGKQQGTLTTVTAETPSSSGAYDVETVDNAGVINPDLTVGIDITTATPLKAMDKVSNVGVKLHGAGFIVTRDEAKALGLGTTNGLEQHIREYRNGRDITSRPRGVMVIDLYGLTIDEVLIRFPHVYEHVLNHVKPERDQNNQKAYRDYWWIFGTPRLTLRDSLKGLPRYIATVETSKHRFFQFLDKSILPDNMLVAIAHDDAYVLGVLSSRIHVVWALALGGRMGVGNDPRYNKTRCFETFPFPDATETQKENIRSLAEQLDSFRKERLAEQGKLTMTDMYNVLEKLRSGAELSGKDKQVHGWGLVTTLLELHNNLDAAVAEAYGISPGLADQDILGHLLALNQLRQAEEEKGLIRYLRPEYQAPDKAVAQPIDYTMPAVPLPIAAKIAFPKTLAEQARAVRQILAGSAAPLATTDITSRFQRARPAQVEDITHMLVALGQAQLIDADIAMYVA